MHHTTTMTFQEAVAAVGEMNATALDAVKIEMMRMTYAHAYVLYATFFKVTLPVAFLPLCQHVWITKNLILANWLGLHPSSLGDTPHYWVIPLIIG